MPSTSPLFLAKAAQDPESLTGDPMVPERRVCGDAPLQGPVLGRLVAVFVFESRESEPEVGGGQRHVQGIEFVQRRPERFDARRIVLHLVGAIPECVSSVGGFQRQSEEALVRAPLDVEPVHIPEQTTNPGDRGFDHGQRCGERVERARLDRTFEAGFHQEQIPGPLFEGELLEVPRVASRERFDPAPRELVGIFRELVGRARSARAQQGRSDAEENDEWEDAEQGVFPALVRSGRVSKSLQKREFRFYRGS